MGQTDSETAEAGSIKPLAKASKEEDFTKQVTNYQQILQNTNITRRAT